MTQDNTAVQAVTGGVGVMGHGDEEYEAHKRGCIACRNPYWLPASSSFFRPHAMNSSCWCANRRYPRSCEMDVDEWRNLPEVEYV